MPADPVLVLAWLALAHLAADFVLQTDAIVRDKFHPGPRAWRGLAMHGAAVGLCLVPVVIAFGAPGIGLLATVTAAHVAIDRWKVRATRHAEAAALADAHRRHAGMGESTGLGAAWTPMPGALFALDQLAHAIVVVLAWFVFIDNQAPLGGFVDAVDEVLGGADRAGVHAATMATVVLIGLLIVNVRAGALFVATLVHPRQAVTGSAPVEQPAEQPPSGGSLDGPHDRQPGSAPGASPPAAAQPAAAAQVALTSVASQESGHAPPAQIGATIGVLERLLIVTLVLTGSEAAIGLVIAAKTLARFRQLDDRDFAEYYLLGTLASVAVALGSALLARAALATAGL